MKTEEVREKIELLISQPAYRPLTVAGLAAKIGVGPKERAAFAKLIGQLEAEGVLKVTKKMRVYPSKKTAGKASVPKNREAAEKSGNTAAKMLSVTSKGGFAALDDGSGDIFIPKHRLAGAMPSDLVEVRILSRTGRLPEAEVKRITERNFREFTGTFIKRGKHAYIVPDGGMKEKIEVPHKDMHLAGDRDKVFAKMKNYPARGNQGVASIVSSYGPADSAAACCAAVLDRLHIRRDFPAPVLEEAEKAQEELSIGRERLDLRDQVIFTIDGAHSKDLDDAVSVEKTEGGYRLGVHIADVSHYVKPGSELDREAYVRGTSIYFGDTVIPMLPKELSNGICSLNPGEDRLSFSALMDIGEDGKMRGWEIRKSVIRSRVKGVYEEVNRLFDGSADDVLKKKYEQVLPALSEMRTLARILTAAREGRGALDFDSDDCEILFDEDGIVREIARRERGEAERLIEEFMLCANEAVASFASGLKMPFIYRVHEEPDARKLETLAAALRLAGLNAKAIRPGLSPADVSKVLKEISGTPKARALNDMVLRSLAKARYSPDCLGHFGLALKYYSHFTSPIRRYPDLAIHRILGDILRQGAGEKISKRYGNFVQDASKQSSEREITAMQVEWDCDAIYKAEYMDAHIGETFEGTVSSVKSFGMYVELENTVEGLIRIDSLKGWFEYDEPGMALACKQTGERYTVGDTVRVIAAKADVSAGQIDFELI